MNGGGAERIVALLSNYWVEKNMQIDIVTFDNENSKSFYELNPAIIHHHLGIIGKYRNIISRFTGGLVTIITLRNMIKFIKPDVIISFMDQTNVLTILASAFLSVPVIVTEHIDIRQYSPGKFWEILRMVLYPFASIMVAVSNGVLESFPKYLRRNATVIPNPLFIEKKIEIEKTNKLEKTIIGMGRLTYQKGFDLLIKAFEMIKNEKPCWNLIIYGEGPMKKELEKLISDLKLENRVKLAGITNNPADKFRQADLFVLSSRFEGFGMVIIEAMACGLPVISFDCPSGPSEIIKNGIDGILVPPENINALSNSMNDLMTNEDKRMFLVDNGLKTARNYTVDKISQKWADLFKKLVKNNEIQ